MEPDPDQAIEVISDDPAFAMVPEWVLYAPISDRAVRLYAVLKRYANDKTGRCDPSRKKLAEKLQVKSVDSVDRAMSQLVDLEAVTIRRRFTQLGEPRTSQYLVHFNPPPAGGRTLAATRSEAATSPRPCGDGGRTPAAQNESQLNESQLNENSPNPHAVGAQGTRAAGDNPRAAGTAPRDVGTNPRALNVDVILGASGTPATGTCERGCDRGWIDEGAGFEVPCTCELAGVA